MHFEVDAIAQVTSVARTEQLACLFRRFRLHTPLFGAGHKHDGVEIFRRVRAFVLVQ